jgi:hypothetical protein
MPDLTMCRPSTPCPQQERCYRFTARPSERQSWSRLFGPDEDGGCEWFMENGKEEEAR